MKKALVTGVTGQDGSYLAELLLEKGYHVSGLVRRSSTVPFERIQHLRDRIDLVYGDLLDPSSLHRAIELSEPEEVYNLAAQSFVPASWTEPVLTAEFTGLGVTRILEAIRRVNPKIRFYQASSSEMFGKVRETPQTETTPFYPRSPYGVAKVYGHTITVNYRESYGLYACSGILFNHECVPGETPVIVRRRGAIDVVPIEELVPHPDAPEERRRVQRAPVEPFEVWDRDAFTQVKTLSARYNEPGAADARTVVRIAAPAAIYAATSEHVSFVEKTPGDLPSERKTGDLKAGDRLALARLAPAPSFGSMTDDEAWLLGALSITGEIVDRSQIRVASNDEAFLAAIERAWMRTATGSVAREDPAGAGGRAVAAFVGAPLRERAMAEELLTARGTRRVPKRVLNADPPARLAYLRGCSDANSQVTGTPSDSWVYLETDSPALAAGLWWLASVTLDEPRRLTLAVDRGRERYRIAFGEAAPDRAAIERVAMPEHRGWLFDFETASGTFHAGVGDGWIHNSPRRGLEFVTRKVTDGVARIVTGAAKSLSLGNLDAKRDWGYAGDYVDAMWRMLQLPEPDDYVIATGESHTVRQLCEIAFQHAGLDWQKHVVIDQKLIRPAEVDLLIGNPAKAKAKLGWTPNVTFRQLIERMVDADLDRAKRAQRG